GGKLLDPCAARRDDPLLRGKPILVFVQKVDDAMMGRALGAGAIAALSYALSPIALGQSGQAAIDETGAHAGMRLGLVAPQSGREMIGRALAGAGFDVESRDSWPEEAPPTWSAAVAAEPPPRPVASPIVPIWRGTFRSQSGRRALSELLESVSLAARRPAADAARPAAGSARLAPTPDLVALAEARSRLRTDLDGL